MSDCTLNGDDCLRGEVKHPYSGAIVAEVQIDAAAKPVGAVSLKLLSRTYSCTVIADPTDPTLTLSGDDAGFFTARLVAGAGGLDKTIQPMEWAQGAVVSQVLSAILQAGSESQATDIAPSILGLALTQWQITQGTVGGALAALVEYLAASLPGLVWRIRSDGPVWLGVPAPAAAAPPDYIVVAPGPEAGQAVWDLNDTAPEPDQIIDGLTLRQVIYNWEPSKLRATVTFAPGPVNQLWQLFAQWQRRIGQDFYRSIPGRVASQNDASSVQFQPDDSRYSPMRKVAIRYGLPDTDCSGVTGRGVSGWDGATPAAPALRGFAPSPPAPGQAGSTATKIKIGKSAAAGTLPLVNRAERDAMHNLSTAIQLAYTVIQGTPAPTNLPSALVLLAAIQNGLGGLISDYSTYEGGAAQYLTTILEGG